MTSNSFTMTMAALSELSAILSTPLWRVRSDIGPEGCHSQIRLEGHVVLSSLGPAQEIALKTRTSGKQVHCCLTKEAGGLLQIAHKAKDSVSI